MRAALAVYFTGIAFYTSLAALAPTPPVGVVFAGRAGAAALAGALALAAAVALVALVRERAAPAAPSRALLGAWLGAAALATVCGLDPGSGLQVVGTMAMSAIVHVALVRAYARPGVAAAVLGTYLVAGTLASLAALAMAATRRPAALWVLNHGRATGVFVTANQCAAFELGFAFVAAGVALASAGRTRASATVAAALGTLTLAATVSQAAWLGAAAGAAFLAVALGARRLAALAALAGVAIAFGVALRPAAAHDPAESFDRVRIWGAGLRVAELFPLTGVGPMAYWRVYPAVRPPNGDAPGTFGALHPHDAYLSLAAETGAVGLGAFVYGAAAAIRAIRRSLRALRPERRRFPLAVCAAAIAISVQGIFDTIGVVQMAFVWIPFAALALAAAESGLPLRDARA